MQELITRLTEKANINKEQAEAALHTIKDFIKEKFPMLAGAVDNFLPEDEKFKMADASDEMGESFSKDHLGGLLGGDVK